MDSNITLMIWHWSYYVLVSMFQPVVFVGEMLHNKPAVRLWNVKVTVVGEWMSDLFDMSARSQQGVVQTLYCVNTAQSNFVWLITVFNQVKFTSVNANWERNPTWLFCLHHSSCWWQGRQTHHLFLMDSLDMGGKIIKQPPCEFNHTGRLRLLLPLFYNPRKNFK